MVQKMLLCLLLLLPCSVAQVHAADLTETNKAALQQMEDTLCNYADSMYTAFLADYRPIYSERFVRKLVQALKTPDSWDYDFPKLTKKINILYPEDKAFRIFNWEIAPGNEQRRYYGAIQMPSSALKLYGMVDHSNDLTKEVEDTILRKGVWFGCLYYRIQKTSSDGEDYYTLFGMNAAHRMSNRKVLDPLTFTDAGPVFGAPIFAVNSQYKPGNRINRFVLEYKKGVQVALNWNAQENNIYFDDLVSAVNDPARKYTYVPSGQINGFKWADGQWNYLQDLVKIVPRKDGQAPINEEQ
ncbi:MAG: hypothetical protein JST36_08935 [Bacteroidetes bacterium]|nr:hypothetical protein [Bacteroidota bacterium]